MSKVLITGAAGFLGRELARFLLSQETSLDIAQVGLTDVCDAPPELSDLDARASFHKANIVESPELLDDLITPETDIVYILHGIMSSQSEADFDLGFAVNVTSVLAVLNKIRACSSERVDRGEQLCKVVLTSSVAVFGGVSVLPEVGPSELNAATPESSYGTAKLTCELWIQDFSRRRYLNGIAVRVPTVTIRPGKPTGAASSYVSGVLREPLQGLASVCPVSPETKAWVCSPRVVIRNLAHAIRVLERPETHLPKYSRTLNLPGTTISVTEQLEALSAVEPSARSLVTFSNDKAVQNIVDTWATKVDCRLADSLGFEPADPLDRTLADFIATLPQRSTETLTSRHAA
ncbi:hypothetical protein PYCC9005_004104 [Savitreella phatthalungensis]